jgi:hypothetical protein
MKRFSKKAILLSAGAMSVCAFAMPSLASASSWGVIGTEHTLTSPNFGFTSAAAGGLTSSCSNSSFTADVRSAAVLTITTGSFAGCTTSGPGIGHCPTTVTPTKYPWAKTVLGPANVVIDLPDIHIIFHGASCVLAGATLRLTGTLSGGTWTGNGANQHEIIYTNAEGLVSHSALGNGAPVTVRSTFRDAQQTLTVS